MNIFKKIGGFFKNIFYPKFKSFLKSVFTKAVATAMAEIQEIAKEVVSQLSVESLTNAEKREKAVKLIKKALKKGGKTVGESIIRAVIELAVIALKNEKAGDA
jgi:hypothetical protein